MSLSKMLHLAGIRKHIQKKKELFGKISRIKPRYVHLSPLHKERTPFLMTTNVKFTTHSRFSK